MSKHHHGSSSPLNVYVPEKISNSREPIDLTDVIVGTRPCRKRPMVVQAVQIHEPFSVLTLEGRMEGKAGDYLMIGVDGERYINKGDIFKRTYDWVDKGS